MARLDLRASLRSLLRGNRRKHKELKNIETAPMLTCNSTPNFQSASGPLTPLTPITPSMISSPTNLLTSPERALELKAATASLTVGRDARMTRNFGSYVVPPMPPIPVDDVKTERLAIRREMSDDSAMKKATGRPTSSTR